MADKYVRAIEVDTRGGFKDAENQINSILSETNDALVEIINNSVDKGHAQIIIVFEKTKKLNRFKE